MSRIILDYLREGRHFVAMSAEGETVEEFVASLKRRFPDVAHIEERKVSEHGREFLIGDPVDWDEAMTDRIRDLEAEEIRIRYYVAGWLMAGDKKPFGETREQFFERVFGVELAKFVERAKAEGLREKIRDYDLAVRGESPLAKRDAA